VSAIRNRQTPDGIPGESYNEDARKITGAATCDLAYDDDGELTQKDEFDRESIYRECDGKEREEKMLSFANVSAAFSLILGWCCGRHKSKPKINRSTGQKGAPYDSIAEDSD
jgi:hypothetical protein